MTISSTGTGRENDPASTGLTAAALAERYDRDRLGFLLDAVRRHGPVVQLGPGTVLVADPPAIRDVLRDTGTSFMMTRTMMREELDSRDGDPAYDRWMVGRRHVLSAMKPVTLDAHQRWLVEQAEACCDRWIQQTSVGDPVPDLEELTSRSFARFAFGEQRYGRVPELTRGLLDALFPILASPFELPRFLRFLPRYRRARNAREALHAELIRLLAGASEASLAGQLARAGMDQPAVAGVLLSMSSAGSGVPAAALAWALVELARRPDLGDQLNDGAPVRWFVDEVLRLWPPTWLVLRETKAPAYAGGWRIPAESAVLVSPYVTHRTADCFTTPEEFRPDRWAELRPQPGAYIPFGTGPRWCLGARFAHMELTAVVTVFARRLRVRLVDQDIRTDHRRTLLPRSCGLDVRAR